MTSPPAPRTRLAAATGLLVMFSVMAAIGSAATGSGATEAAQDAIPTPESSLGFTVGADFELATYDESIAYFRLLDAATNRLSLVDIGRTSEGRPWYVALISSAANLAELERFKREAEENYIADQSERNLEKLNAAVRILHAAPGSEEDIGD